MISLGGEMMGTKLIDFHVQIKAHELHGLKSDDLARAISSGLTDASVTKVQTAGRGFDLWIASEEAEGQ